MSYQTYLDGDPLIVTAALTGGVHGKEANPAIPETPEEIGRAAAAVEDAGIAVVHLHARRDSGGRSFRTKRFQEIYDAVRRYTDDVVDNVYYRRGEPATSNEQLIERVVHLAETLKPPVATPVQARDILGL